MFGLSRKTRRTPSRTQTLRHRLNISIDRLENRSLPSTAGLVGSMLMVNGTSGSDAIQITTNPDHSVIYVQDSGRTIAKFDMSLVKMVEVHAGAGDDKVSMNTELKLPALLDGGAGNDSLAAGSGSTILVGGAGDDVLAGGASRDIAIGGDGSDTVRGGANEDIVIAGRFRFENNSDVLIKLQNEWNSGDPYKVRVDRLRHGTDSLPAFDVTNVTNDGSIDYLEGGSGLDWYFVGDNTKVIDLAPGEAKN